MRATIMEIPLLLSQLIDYAADNHGGTEVVGRGISGGIQRASYLQLRSRAKRLAKCLAARGIVTDACVGSLAWNTCDHIEEFYGVLGIGAGLHTINPRLSVKHLVQMIERVGDQLIFVDAATIGVAGSIS